MSNTDGKTVKFPTRMKEGVDTMNKVDDFLTMTKLNDLLKKKDDEEKKASNVVWIFAIVGIVVALIAAAYGIYRFFKPDYLDDFEDDFEDEFEDDFFDDDEEDNDK